LQNSPLEKSCVIVALIENYSTSKTLKVSPEKSHILSCDTLVANERYNELFFSLMVLNLEFQNLKAINITAVLTTDCTIVFNIMLLEGNYKLK